MAATGLLLAWAPACTAPEHQVALALDGPTCTAEDLAGVRVISVELLGVADQRPCALAKRCLFDLGGLDSVDDVVALLAEANQPLVDVADEDAHTVAVIGHGESCWGTDDHVMCGYGDLAEVRGGVLAMSLSCGPCPDDEILFCP